MQMTLLPHTDWGAYSTPPDLTRFKGRTSTEGEEKEGMGEEWAFIGLVQYPGRMKHTYNAMLVTIIITYSKQPHSSLSSM